MVFFSLFISTICQSNKIFIFTKNGYLSGLRIDLIISGVVLTSTKTIIHLLNSFL